MDDNEATKKVVVTSFLTNILDIVLNTTVGILTGSVSAFSQSMQAVSDLTTSGTLVLGVKRAQKQANEDYPFGYGREVFFWVLISGLFMLIGTGGASLYLGISRFLNPQPLENVALVVMAFMLGCLTNGYALSVSFRLLKKRDRNTSILNGIRHSSLMETKAAFLIDGAGTVAAVFGLFSVLLYIVTGIEQFDAVGSILIGLVMVVFALLLIKDVKDFLVGKAASKRIQKMIQDAATSVKDVEEVLDLRTMFLGSARLLAVIELHIHEGLTTPEIEKLTDKVKEKIIKAVPRVEIVQVEVETPDGEL